MSSSDEVCINNPACIQQVWYSNLYEEMTKVRQIVTTYPIIAMDTEFPGQIFKKRKDSSKEEDSSTDYEIIRKNVNLMKIIQLGLTFMNEKGERPPGISTWQFNFKFDVEQDECSEESVTFLQRCGVKFDQHKKRGFLSQDFAYSLLSSNLILTDEVVWVTFHGCYDFAYLVKVMRGPDLPEKQDKFMELFEYFFPRAFDIKYLMTTLQLGGGLQDIADQLDVKREGQAHQAGSDSLLTAMVFYRMQALWFGGRVNEKVYNLRIFGLNE